MTVAKFPFIEAHTVAAERMFGIPICHIDVIVRRCRSEELPSPIDVHTDSGRVSSAQPLATAADTDITTRRPVSKTSSQVSQSSLLRKAAMNEVRRAFFTSDSSSSLADRAVKSKVSVKDSDEAVRVSQSQEFPHPVSDRLQLML